MDTLVKVAQVVSYAVGAVGVVVAVWVYWGNARRERAKWADSLFNLFFVKPDLKRVRDVIDCAPNDPAVQNLVSEEGADWTDYLNFFEFVQYLKISKQLSNQDVQALFGYYLRCLKKHRAIVEYINTEENGFDYLRGFLAQ